MAHLFELVEERDRLLTEVESLKAKTRQTSSPPPVSPSAPKRVTLQICSGCGGNNRCTCPEVGSRHWVDVEYVLAPPVSPSERRCGWCGIPESKGKGDTRCGEGSRECLEDMPHQWATNAAPRKTPPSPESRSGESAETPEPTEPE